MVLQHHRTQQPVGQGFFHSAQLEEDGRVFRYIFDCGAMSTYKAARAARIKDYRKGCGSNALIDVLFISHAHADHLNGLEQLLSPGLKIDTIVLPLMNVADRLIAYCQDLADDAASAQNGFYRDFLIDPASALGRFKPRQILFVRPQHRDGGAPGSDGDGFGDPDGGQDVSSVHTDTRLGFKLVGRGSVHKVSNGAEANSASSGAGGSDVSEIEDTQALAVPLGTQTFWLLAPYVDPTIETDRKLFIKALKFQLKAAGAKTLSLNVGKMTTSELQTVVIDHVAALSAAYASINKNLNVTSLCLYSGPVPQAPKPKMSYAASFGKWRTTWISDERVAWLTTGDAALKESKRRKPFLKHYGKLLDLVTTLILPHHGSEHNFHPELIFAVKPLMFVVAAGYHKGWRHPGSTVIQAVASAGSMISVVTESELSEVEESVQLL